MGLNDVIAAISTPSGAGGISIIRVCGNGALECADKIFLAKKKGATLAGSPSHSIIYGLIKDGNETVDEVLCSVMRAPKSYTCDDTVEINCHGGIVVTRRILGMLLRRGAREAEPGEFTKRAFLNGRLDLSQAEAVIDIINAKTELSQRAAAAALGGGIREAVSRVRSRCIDAVALLEVAIDYPEHELDLNSDSGVIDIIDEVIAETSRLAASAGIGRIVRSGIKTAILGMPNVGKSSLLNSLLCEERAIVTDIPGTTRDIIEEYADIGGVALKIADTAGIRETDDAVEKIGVERALRHAEDAELILLVLDGSRKLNPEDIELMDRVKGRRVIAVINKSDSASDIETEEVYSRIPASMTVEVSAKLGHGIDSLCRKIKELFMLGALEASEEKALANERHRVCLENALASLNAARENLISGTPEDFISMDLQEASAHLAEITGDAADEEIIDRIFSSFCLGK